MLLSKIRNKQLYILIFIVFLGFFTGINYQQAIDEKTALIAKKSMEFGLLQLFEGKGVVTILLFLLLSTCKHFFLFLLGSINRVLVILIPVNLFAVSFKCGLILSFIYEKINFNGIIVVVFLFVIILWAIFIADILMKKCLSVCENTYTKVIAISVIMIIINTVIILIAKFFVGTVSGIL